MSDMVSRLRNRWFNDKRNRIPAGFCKLDYIESTGTQYIDSSIVPKSNTATVTTDCIQTEQVTDRFLYGVNNVNGIRFNLNFYNSSSLYFRFHTKEYVHRNYITTQRHKYVHGNKIYIDGVLVHDFNVTSSLEDINTSLYIFRDYNGKYPWKGKLFSLIIQEYGCLVCDFWPVLCLPGTTYTDGNNGQRITTTSAKPGLYDTVSGRLFVNQDSGADFLYPQSV